MHCLDLIHHQVFSLVRQFSENSLRLRNFFSQSSMVNCHSCCTESQREAALLLGQFASADSDCKALCHLTFFSLAYQSIISICTRIYSCFLHLSATLISCRCILFREVLSALWSGCFSHQIFNLRRCLSLPLEYPLMFSLFFCSVINLTFYI